MPIYEYVCATCGETLEAIQAISAPPLEWHEGCGGKLQRVASVAATRVTGGSGSTDPSHTSMLRFQENQRIAADKKKRTGR